ncbi:MAG TPA: transcription termination factor Rho [Schlesneria sp.]
MTEMDSDVPKKVTKPRRRKAAAPVENVSTVESVETTKVEKEPQRPVIEDVLEETAAARAEIESAPNERDMDFEAMDSGPSEAGSESFNGAPAGGAGGGGDFYNDNRRRRRRRGRGRGPNGQETGGGGGYAPQGGGGYAPQGGGGYAPQGGGGGYAPQQGQNRGPRGRNGQMDRRGPQQGGGQRRDGGQRGPSMPRGMQSNEPRGPEVLTPVQGILELHPKGYGFLRDPKAGYVSQESDSFVSGSLIEKFGLREGVLITGENVPGGRGQGPRLKSIQTIEGRLPEFYAEIKNFDSLTPINPHQQIKLETGPTPITMRVMDLLTPIGKGQRALIVAPPRTGKTMLLQEIADAVSKNYPDIYLIVLLIDERPEEVTEMRRRVHGEVVASSLDREVENHIRVSQLVFERTKRMAEAGRDVFLLLDSITRTARAFNKWTNSGRTGTGGLDVKAMDLPKKMFGMARQFDEGGSLTVVGTALIETGSRMDDAIFQEFKGTGNMEMVLSRDLADRRIWPSIDITKSGTRREEKILSPDSLEGITLLRRSLISMSPVEAMEQLTKTLQRFPSNEEFVSRIRHIL